MKGEFKDCVVNYRPKNVLCKIPVVLWWLDSGAVDEALDILGESKIMVVNSLTHL